MHQQGGKAPIIRYKSVAYADIEGDLAVAKCYQNAFEFPCVRRRVVEARFDGGEVTSDGGSLLLRQADRYLGLTEAVARALSDRRRRKSCIHDVHSLVRQRVYALALGYEDLNDHDELRREVRLQTAVERDRPLASASTLCRFENRADATAAWRIHEVLVERFIGSFKAPPKQLMPDFDATDDPVHGEQAGRFFHGFYRRYCFLPLEVAALVRAPWVGLHRGTGEEERLNALTAEHRAAAAAEVAETGEKVRRFVELTYGARTWDRPRRVIVKIERPPRCQPALHRHLAQGRSEGVVRAAVLCPRGHGKPDQ